MSTAIEIRPIDAINGIVRAGKGGIEVSLTEAGDIGVFIAGEPSAIGNGDTAAEALADAISNYEDDR